MSHCTPLTPAHGLPLETGPVTPFSPLYTACLFISLGERSPGLQWGWGLESLRTQNRFMAVSWPWFTRGQRGCSIREDLVAVVANFPMRDVASFLKEHRTTLSDSRLWGYVSSKFLQIGQGYCLPSQLQISLFAIIDLSTVIFRVWQHGMGHWAHRSALWSFSCHSLLSV